jgi:predicted DNA-binding transcriptional regulator AlpA
MPARRLQLAPMPPPVGVPYSVHDRIAQFDRPMKITDLAPILGVSDDVLYRMVNQGDVPSMVIPGAGRKLVRFDPAAVAFWYRTHNTIQREMRKAS